MRRDRIGAKRPSDVARSHEDARLALRRVVQATRAHLAEMDRLLARADRLVSHAVTAPYAREVAPTRKRRHARTAGIFSNSRKRAAIGNSP